MTLTNHISKRLIWLLALYPVFWTLLFVVFLVQVRWMTGHWPLWWEPRGNEFTQLQDSLLFLGFLASPLIALTACVLAVIKWVRARRFPLPLAGTLVIFGGWFLLMTSGWVGAVNWYFDCW